jgi:glycosyltransferase involved in cell wall biosynthesis
MKISFVSALTLDTDLHKTRELEILKALADRENSTSLTAMISKNRFQLEDSRTALISIPIRSVPIISPLVWATFLLFFLPIHILVDKPDFIIMDPEISVVSSIPSCILSRLTKAKFILDVRGTPVEVISLRGRLLELMFNVSVVVAKRLFNGFAFVSYKMKEEVSSKFGLDQKTLALWTNGVSLNLFNPQKSLSKSEELKKNLNLTGKFIVFYHGAFTPSRGLTETLDAMQIINKKYPQIVFFFLGSGTNLKELIQQKDLQGAVILHDPVPYEEVPKFIGLSDVGIVPLPNTPDWRFQNALNLLEYLAMEKVVLATDIPANRIVVKDEQCCIYIPSANPHEIAKKIEYAYANKDKLADWGKSGRKIIQTEYTWAKVAEKIEHDLQSISSHCDFT